MSDAPERVTAEEAFKACVYLDRAIPVYGKNNAERIRAAADEILALRAENASLRDERDRWKSLAEAAHRDASQHVEIQIDAARLREALVRVESETAQIWPQSLLDDMPAVQRIQDIARRALNRETTDDG